MEHHIVFERGKVISKRYIAVKEVLKLSLILGDYVDEYHFEDKPKG